ncbi:MAG TPA: SURF1 family protein [Rhodanobacteraceae bacterium]|nr:SURF1 family protein [Rhodanobacteraceae bacterium]
MMRLRRPSWFAVLMTLVGVVLFIIAGFWQLDRARQKELLLARFAAADRMVAVPLASLGPAPDADTYPHVRAHVEFLPRRLYVLDDQIHSGRSGVQVFTPALLLGPCTDDAAANCHPASSRVLLVDMGFLPRQAGMQRLPAIPPLKSARAEIHGLYAPPPASGLKLGGNALARQPTWPKLTTYIDLEQIGADLDRPVYPRVLLLDPDPATPYIRAWKPQTMPPARHRAYAFQWFCFAAAVLVIFFALHRRRADADVTDEPNDDDDGQA